MQTGRTTIPCTLSQCSSTPLQKAFSVHVRSSSPDRLVCTIVSRMLSSEENSI